MKHRDMLQGQVQQMQQQNTDLTTKVAKLEQERLLGNGELVKLREAFAKLQEEADLKQKRKEKLDKELKDMRQGLEAKQSEVNVKREEYARGEDTFMTCQTSIFADFTRFHADFESFKMF